MIIHLDPTGSIEGFSALLDEMSHNEDVKGLLILACDANGFTPDAIDEALQRVPVPLWGGIFPAIIHGREKLERGTIVAGLDKRPDVHVVPDLSSPGRDFDEAFASINPVSPEARTLFVLNDGYAQNISSFIDSLYDRFGLQFTYIGGGAGSVNPAALDMSKTPCLLTNKGLIKDSALLVLLDIESGVGAGHGFHKISGPYKVTESTGNAIQSLDWKPAFEAYKQIVKEHSGETITGQNFFSIAKRFPFGISRMGSELIVRDPYTAEGESLIVATEIAQESFIDILTGTPDSLVAAAKQSFTAAMDAFQEEANRTELLIDCISRALFLEDEFDREIEAVYQENVPLIGALSMGEIANNGKDYLELYNKTCVVGILAD